MPYRIKGFILLVKFNVFVRTALLFILITTIVSCSMIHSCIQDKEYYDLAEKAKVQTIVTNIDEDWEYTTVNDKQVKQTCYIVTKEWKYNGKTYSTTYSTNNYPTLGASGEITIDALNPSKIIYGDYDIGIIFGSIMLFIDIVIFIAIFFITTPSKKEEEKRC